MALNKQEDIFVDEYTYIDGVYFGTSDVTKPTDINEPAFWWNIDNNDEHKVYQFDVVNKTWIPQD